ncbi:MAG: threonine--tRNA ligase [Blastocatellia bacterium]|jgi:threonyl-tRNA synthetase|nr:threonine--tRNA ligase [Blastocatellia bacterium]
MEEVQNVVSSAADRLKAVDPKLAKRALAARVNGQLVDLTSSAPEGASVEAITTDSPEALEIYRHSTAHLLAAAVLELFPGTKLGVGPALMEDPNYGFYYDFLPDRPFTPEDLDSIEKKMRELVKRNLRYERVEMSKAEMLRLFAEEVDDKLKCELIEEKGGDVVSAYRLGDQFIDFCLGPHLPLTSKIKAFKLLSLAGAYWRGDEHREQMQRIYGTAFFEQDELDRFLKQREEAKKRDHRRLGPELGIFAFSENVGPNLVLWLPNGAFMRRQMEDFIYHLQYDAGYQHVYTPQIGSSALWEKSGHTKHYRSDMFPEMDCEDGAAYQLRPMNCPFHVEVYRTSQRSYRDLPLRIAEMGTVYRYERSGVQHGLLRVRGFTQDDAHLFIRADQLEEEMDAVWNLAGQMLAVYGFDQVHVELSLRDPNDLEKYLGDPAVWDQAEAALAAALDKNGVVYKRMEGEAAFYGPKIDLKVVDAIGRMWQLSTIQLDFNLPNRFDLEYIGEDNRPHRPIMIHRAIYGSFERFMGVLIEHFAGHFPVWLTPVQARVLPISDRHNDYANSVTAELRAAGLRVESDLRSETMKSKIRDAQMKKIPFMLVVGDREVEERLVAVRDRKNGDIGSMPVNVFAERALDLARTRSRDGLSREAEPSEAQSAEVPTPA